MTSATAKQRHQKEVGAVYGMVISMSDFELRSFLDRLHDEREFGPVFNIAAKEWNRREDERIEREYYWKK